MLRIAKTLAIPLDAVTETFAILAKRGVGKTYTALVLAEELLAADQVVCIVDPVGVCWGLRSSADGKSAGFPIVVMGGEHGDVPLEEAAGETIADFLVDERQSCVLDLSLFFKRESVRFVTAFAERLYHRNRKALHLILDEADAFAPQKPMKEQARMLGAIEDIVRRGRARGLGVTLVTQRSAVLNKNVLTQIESLFALRTLSPQDQKAIEAWIVAHDALDQHDVFMESLASLPVGTAWFWSPGWLDAFQKIEIRKRKTFDSSATPKVGGSRIDGSAKKLADVDLEALKQRISSTIEKAKANDPRELRKKVAALERELRKKHENRVEPKRVEVSVLDGDDLIRLEASSTVLGEISSSLQSELSALSRTLENLAVSIAKASTNGHGKVEPRRRTLPVREERARPRRTTWDSGVHLPPAKQRILDALAFLEQIGVARADRVQLAFMADTKATSSSYANNISALRTDGLLDYPGPNQVVLTDEGRSRSDASNAPATTEELHDLVHAKLPPAKWKILRALIEAYPHSISKDELAELAETTVTSSSYANNLSSLRTSGLIDYPAKGEAVAQDVLFLP